MVPVQYISVILARVPILYLHERFQASTIDISYLRVHTAYSTDTSNTTCTGDNSVAILFPLTTDSIISHISIKIGYKRKVRVCSKKKTNSTQEDSLKPMTSRGGRKKHVKRNRTSRAPSGKKKQKNPEKEAPEVSGGGSYRSSNIPISENKT